MSLRFIHDFLDPFKKSFGLVFIEVNIKAFYLQFNGHHPDVIDRYFKPVP